MDGNRKGKEALAFVVLISLGLAATYSATATSLIGASTTRAAPDHETAWTTSFHDLKVAFDEGSFAVRTVEGTVEIAVARAPWLPINGLAYGALDASGQPYDVGPPVIHSYVGGNAAGTIYFVATMDTEDYFALGEVWTAAHYGTFEGFAQNDTLNLVTKWWKNEGEKVVPPMRHHVGNPSGGTYYNQIRVYPDAAVRADVTWDTRYSQAQDFMDESEATVGIFPQIRQIVNAPNLGSDGLHICTIKSQFSNWLSSSGWGSTATHNHQHLTGRDVGIPEIVGCATIAPQFGTPAAASVVQALDRRTDDNWDPTRTDHLGPVVAHEMGHNLGEGNHPGDSICYQSFLGFCFDSRYNLMATEVDLADVGPRMIADTEGKIRDHSYPQLGFCASGQDCGGSVL